MKVIIAGSRTATYQNVMDALTNCHFSCDATEIVSGTAGGADTHGESVAHTMKIPVKRFPAQWATHGKAAGPIRNAEMASYADALIAVWDGKSRGTKNMIENAQKNNLLIYVHMFGG